MKGKIIQSKLHHRLSRRVKMQSFDKASHLGLLRDKRVVKAVVTLLERHSSSNSIWHTAFRYAFNQPCA